MDIPSFAAFAHVLSRCQCGHATHIGRGLQGLRVVVCEECDAIAAAAKATMCVVSTETADLYALTVGTNVHYDGAMRTIVEIEQIMLMQGRLQTPFVRVLLAVTA